MRHPTRKNANGLIIAGFKRLRKHIAENVPPREIYMDWYFGTKIAGAVEDVDVYAGCGSVACLIGHNAVAFGCAEDQTVTACQYFADKTLGTSDSKLVGMHAWPPKLRQQYYDGNARQKKAAVLARLDRIIERGDLD